MPPHTAQRRCVDNIAARTGSGACIGVDVENLAQGYLTQQLPLASINAGDISRS